MAYLLNDARSFADDFAEGLALAHPELLRAVSGGVVRSTAVSDGSVAVVTGGGSGHFPAFGGLVGAGLAHAAALGNVFASPSTQQIVSVARSASRGGGVLLAYGNYAGDVLNFRGAAERLRREGIDARTVEITDDVSSAGADDTGRRRGIAGGLVVYKVVGAAADRGDTLDEVERIARRANELTRSIGAAFTGCTLPGAPAPLFTVPAGRMALGMGIHGEPGIAEIDLPSADGLARLLVERLLAERPENAGDAAVVLVNGLGSVSGEELYLLYRGIARELATAGIAIQGVEIGELTTSFEMAGVSLTLAWLDDELLPLWSAPADAPGFRRGDPGARIVGDVPAVVEPSADRHVRPRATEASRRVGEQVLSALEAVHGTVVEHLDELGRLDAVAGDGDHGIGMQRGASAAVGAAERAVEAAGGAGTVLASAADAWSDRAGGTSGVLWGLALTALAESIGDEEAPTPPRLAAAVRSAVDRIAEFGRAQRGDKTMLDAMIPFADVLERRTAGGDGIRRAWREAAGAATVAASATASLTPRIGRARPLAAQSLGTPDPGAVSFALAVMAVSAILDNAPTTEMEKML